MPKAPPTPIEAFLAPLAALARKQPDIEGLVFWRSSNGWPDAPAEALEAEEIAFYAEGLLIDGFQMHWSVVAQQDSADLADHIRLYFWQDDSAPPAPPAGWVVQRRGLWPAG